MSNCPYCGDPPTATTQDDDTGNAMLECDNAHVWPAEDGES